MFTNLILGFIPKKPDITCCGEVDTVRARIEVGRAP